MSKRARRSRAEWGQLLEEFKQSNVKLGSFCEARGLNRYTFQYWRSKLKDESEGARGFVRVEPGVAPRRSILLRKGGVEVELPGDYPGEELAALVNGLSC